MKCEYVLSAVRMFRIHHQDILKKPIIHETIAGIFDKFNKYYPSNNVSILYNAFTEASFTPLIKKYKTHSYTDSGGLQMITVKSQTLSDSDKEKIYKTQSESDFAMCFDDIPLYIDENKKGKSARTDMSGKYVVGDEMFDKGKSTGLNIVKQIEYFKSVDSKTKVFVILQGNSYEDWLNFAKGVFSEIKEEHHEHLEGLALADTCLGNSSLEMADMMSVIPDIDCPEFLKKRIHLLGVGSVARLIPVIIMIKSGYVDKDTHISYDSSSYSLKHMHGRYDTKGGTVRFPRLRFLKKSNPTNIILKEIISNMKKIGADELYDFETDIFHDVFINSTFESFKTISDKKPEYYHPLVIFYLAFTLSQVINFTDIITSLNSKGAIMSHISKRKEMRPLISLWGVKTREEYLKWVQFAKRCGIRSNRISRIQSHDIPKNDLSSFFMES